MESATTTLAGHNASAVRRGWAALFAIFALAADCFAQSGPGFLPSPVRVVSTVPANGDVNPYGVAFVPKSLTSGMLHPNDILVSNFNNAENLQGTGTTIIRIPETGSPSLFYQSAAPYTGLSTALSVLPAGFVLVGSFPTADGTCNTVTPGALLVLSTSGQLMETFTGSEIDGPWDMTVNDQGSTVQAFLSNALNGTVTRLDFQVMGGQLNLKDSVEVASGYQHRCDPASLVDAPTGLVYDSSTDTLFVASTLDNAVFAVPNAAHATDSQGTGSVIYQDATHLHGALALAEAPTGHLLVTNNDVINPDPNQPSEIVEFTQQGKFVKELPVDPNLGGSFGVQVHTFGNNIAQLAAVDDDANSITIWTLPAH